MVGVLFSLSVIMKWMRVVVVVIGVIVALLAVTGILMWSVSGQDALVALSVIFLIAGVGLSIGALAWPRR